MIVRVNDDSGALVASWRCSGCAVESAALILIQGYADGSAEVRLCKDCALQLARKVLEDICELATRGGRNG